MSPKKSTSSAARAKPLSTARLKSGKKKNSEGGEDSPLSSLSSMSSPSLSPSQKKDSEEPIENLDIGQENSQEGAALLDGLLDFGADDTTAQPDNNTETNETQATDKESVEYPNPEKVDLPSVSQQTTETSIQPDQADLLTKSIDFQALEALQHSPIAQQLDHSAFESLPIVQPSVFDNTIDPQQFLQPHALDASYAPQQEEHIMIDDHLHQEFNPEQVILDIVESQERFTRSRSGRVIKKVNPDLPYNDQDEEFGPSGTDQEDATSIQSSDNKRQRKDEPIQYHPIEGFLNMKPRELGRGVQIGTLNKAICRTEEQFNPDNIQTHKTLLPYMAPTINVDHWTPIVIELIQQDLDNVAEHNGHIKEIYSLMIQILKAGQANEPMPSVEHLSPQASQLFRHFLKSTDTNIAHDPYILTHICRKLTISVMFKYNIPIRSFSTQANSLYSMYGDSNEMNDEVNVKNEEDINAPMSINFMKQYNPFKLPAKILTMLSKK